MVEVIPLGICQCGCGEKTRIATINDKAANKVKGRPAKYIKGHNMRAGFKGENSGRWKGGRSVSPHGYVVLHTPEGRKYEHIMIAENILGRPLPQYGKGDPRNLVVHHIDGNKLNNEKSNLLICTHSYHTSLHRRLEASTDWPEFPKIDKRPERFRK